MHTRANSTVEQSASRANTEGLVGLGKLHSKSIVERSGGTESMRNEDRTEFHDTIAILGKPEFCIPIGLATFRCEVTGEFTQPRSGASATGSAEALAEFGVETDGVVVSDRQEWSFPSMLGPQGQPLVHVLTATILFVIGRPIRMFSTLNLSSVERALCVAQGDLSATLALRTVLQPIQVEWVSNSSAETISGTQSEYYTEDEAGAQDVTLRTARLLLAHL